MSLAEKIAAFLQDRPPGGHAVVLSALDRDGDHDSVAEWTTAEVTAALDESPAAVSELVETKARAHTEEEGETCKFSLQWQRADERVLRTLKIKLTPDKPDVRKLSGVTDSQTIEMLLNANAALCKQVLSSVGSIGTAYERALAKQGELLEQALRRERELMASQIIGDDDSAEARERRERRDAIISPLLKRLPEVLDTGLAMAQRALAGDIEPPAGDDPADTGTEAH